MDIQAEKTDIVLAPVELTVLWKDTELLSISVYIYFVHFF